MKASTRAARRAIAAAALLGSAALVAGCGSSGHPAAGGTVTVTARPAAGSSTSVTSPPVTPAVSEPAGLLAGCPASALHPKLGVAQGTAGTIYQVVDLTNISSSTCTLQGYPGVSFVSGVGGQQIGHPATRNPVTPPKLITLAPGQVANFLLAVTDAGAVCKPVAAHWLKIYPPNDTGALYLSYATQACASPSVSTMKTSVVAAGAGSAG